MKKTITFLSLAFSLFAVKAQTTVADFESLTLAADTFYESHTGASWSTDNATFRYKWDATYSLWDAGFAYTNKNNITNGTFTNLYGAITGKGYNNSNQYVTGSQGYMGENMRVKLNSTEKSVSGFYVTNTTYGYKTMLNGGGPARAFGDTLHTSSGLIPGNFPDWFALTVFGYNNGVKKTDTVAFFLADYRFTDNTKDYIVNKWEWVDCSGLGEVDSVSFVLTSSDKGQYGINNPTYFCIDNFSTIPYNLTGISSLSAELKMNAYPNPFTKSLHIVNTSGSKNVSMRLMDVSGKLVSEAILSEEKNNLDLSALENGVYFLELSTADQKTIKRVIKN